MSDLSEALYLQKPKDVFVWSFIGAAIAVEVVKNA